MSALPKDVQASVDEANRIAEEMQAVQQEGTPDAPPDAEPQAPESEAAAPIGTVGDKAGHQEEAPQAPVTPPQGSVEDPNSETWEHRYKTLQGMYNAEVPRLQAQLRDQDQQMGQLREQMEMLQASLRAQPEPEPAPQSLFTDQDREDYGEDMIDLIRRGAREEVAKATAKLEAENAELRQQLAGTQETVTKSAADVAKDRFLRELDEAMPEWRTLNQDPGFMQWLTQVDALSGRLRDDLLQAAVQSGDAERAVLFFRGYQREMNAVAQPPTLPAAPTPEQGNGRVSLEAMAAPGSGSSSGSDGNPGANKRIWKESEIGVFYEQSRRGAFKGREGDKAAIEADIHAAMREGRILAGQ